MALCGLPEITLTATSRLRIDLRALAANYQRLQRQVVGECAAVVKADAYGLGVAAVSARLLQLGCRSFFVATLAEGIALRALMAQTQNAEVQIYVFAGPAAEEVADYLAHQLIPVINSPVQLARWRTAGTAPMALHLDTGINRLGYVLADLQLADLQSLNLVLLMTHLACADTPEHTLNRLQLTRFQQAKQQLAAAFPGLRTSIGNSAGTLLGADFQGDLARPGIALYGGSPFVQGRSDLQPVATLEGRLLQVRQVPAGASVGYGATYTSPAAVRLGIVGLGYADGLPRQLSNLGSAAFAGQRLPIRGRISMDLTAVALDDLAEPPAEGDWVEFFGTQISVDAVAAQVGTISYELLTGISNRPARIYQH